MNIKEALNMLQHDVEVDTRTAALVHGVELLLGGAEGLGYSDDDRSDLRTTILQLLGVRWVQARQEADDRLLEAAESPTGTTMCPEAPQGPSLSPAERRRAFYVVPIPDVPEACNGDNEAPGRRSEALQTVGLMALVCWECLANPDFPALTGAISASSHLKRPGPSGTGRQEP